MRGMAAITYDALVAVDHGENVAHFDENTTTHASWAEFMDHWTAFCDQIDVVWRWDVLYDDDGTPVMRVMTVRLELGRVEAHVVRLGDVASDAVAAWLRHQWERLVSSWAPVGARARRRARRSPDPVAASDPSGGAVRGDAPDAATSVIGCPDAGP